MQISDILGLNARTQLFSYAYNDSYGKSLASSKVSTKRALKKANVAAPEIYAKFSDLKHLVNFDWEKLPDAFALKPSQGLGGEGIVIVKKRAKDQNLPSKKANNAWITTQKKRVTVDDLKLHVMDILEGAYSMGNVPDVAYIEEYVGRHNSLIEAHRIFVL